VGNITRYHIIAALLTAVLLILPQVGSDCAQDIVLAGKVVVRISAPGPFGSVVQRAAKIDQRVTQAISVEDVGDPSMYITTVGGHPGVFIGKTMLVKVYSGDAAYHGVSKWRLARTWKGNFAKYFPMAEPCTRLSKDAASGELARAQARTAASAKVTIPPQDWAIVAVTLDHLARARPLVQSLFEQELPDRVQQIYDDIAQSIINAQQGRALPKPPHYPGTCPQLGGCPACQAAKHAAVARQTLEVGGIAAEEGVLPVPKRVRRRIESGLKLLRSVDHDRYQRDRVMVASTLVKEARKALSTGDALAHGPRK